MITLRGLSPVLGFALLVAGQARPPAQGPAGAPQQAQPQPPSTGVILGQIVDAPSGRPIPGAVVTLSGTFAPRPPIAPGATPTPAELAAIQAASAPRRLMTDSSGTFVFIGLPKGSFRLNADAAGYLSGTFGQGRIGGPSRAIDVDQGERRTGLVVKLWPYGSINGTITDESGDPAVGMMVRLVRVLTTNGQRRLSSYQSSQTDDRGAYRFSQLSPGDYLIAITQTVTSVPSSTVDAYMEASRLPNGSADLNRALQSSGAPIPYQSGYRLGDQQFLMNGGMSTTLGPPAADQNGKTFAYQTTFFPAATTSAEALTVSVASGQERSGIDLQLRMAQTVRVSGTVIGPDGPAPNMGVKLVPAGLEANSSLENGFETATTSTDAYGAFTFPAVPTGAYTLKALKVPRPAPAPPPPPPPPGAAGRGVQFVSPLPQPLPSDPVLWAESPVSVGDADVTGLSIALRAGAKVSGRIVFEGTATPPTPDMLQRMSVSVSPADGRPNVVGNAGGASGRVSATGQFSTVGFPPGKYSLSSGVNTPGWYYKAATLGGRNIDEDPLDLQGSDVSGVTITFVDHTTQITGTVRDPSVRRDMAAVVFFFPADYAAAIDRGTVGRRTRSLTVSGQGTFTMGGLPPGDYLVVAVNPDAIGEARDKAFYDSLARAATRMSLGDGERRSLDLTVSPIR